MSAPSTGARLRRGYTSTVAQDQSAIGNRIAPARFLLFGVLALVAVPAAIALTDWAEGVMIGFDIAALAFLAVCIPLLGETSVAAMRRASARNDANRAMLLAIAAVASVAVLAAVAGELGGAGRPAPAMIGLIVATLVLAWLFGNSVYALHYAHLFYVSGDDGDSGGLDFPGTDQPRYWDFIYFAFTLGMTFQTSDTAIRSTTMRKVVTAHSLIAFVFNLGIVAFTINVLGGG